MYYKYHASNNWVRGTAYVRTPNLVFQPSTTLPVVRITGAGVPVQIGLRVVSGPQIDYRQAVPLAGYGGLSAGMRYTYPLSSNPLGQPLNVG